VKAVLTDDSTVTDLLDAIKAMLAADPSINKKKRVELIGHYGWTTNVIAKALNVVRASLTIRQMVDNEARFKQFVFRQRISESAKTMLPCYRRGMIREANTLGWSPCTFALEEEWKPAKAAVKGVAAGLSIIKRAIENELHMNQFSDDALNEWGREKECKGSSYRSVISCKSAFRGAIRSAGLQASFPLLCTSIAETYRIGARELPLWLRREIAVMLWDMRSEARIDGRRFPFSSAHGVVQRFQDLLGFAQRIAKISCNSLDELVAERLIRKYILFLYNEKRWKRESIRSSVHRIINALKNHPVLRNCDFTLIKKCVHELPEDDDTNIDPEFDGAEVLLEDLAAISGKIRDRRQQQRNKHPRVKAWLALKEFVIFFLVTHPWPTQCLRMCRIDDPKRNLFRGPVPRDSTPFALASWLKRELRKNPRLCFWQFDFSPEQTGLGRYARGAVVLPLARKLTAYLKHRKELLRGRPDPGTLLVNFAGRPFDSSGFSKLVADICREYCGVAVQPSEFRRKFLLDWLTEDPNDVETIAAILWISPQSVNAELERHVHNFQQRPNHRRGRWVKSCRSSWD
jgi:hypothetical protein